MNLVLVNRYVLMAVGLFALLLYFALVYAGFADFSARLSESGSRRKASRRQKAGRGVRKEEMSVMQWLRRRTGSLPSEQKQR